MLISTIACLWDPFPPTGLPHPDLIRGFVPVLIASCYAVFSWYPWEACSFFLRETEEQWNWGRGGAEVGLREREEGGCSLDLLCVRIIKKKGRKKPQKTGETFLEQQTDSLPSLLERYFQIPCDWKNEWTNAWGTTQRGWTFLQGQQSLWCICISRKALFARTSLQCSKGGKRTRV